MKEKEYGANKVIAEVQGIDPVSRTLKINDLFKWDPFHDTFKGTGESVILERIMEQRGWSSLKLDEEIASRSLILQYMRKNNIKEHNDVFSMIQGYYTNPGALLKKIRGKKNQKTKRQK